MDIHPCYFDSIIFDLDGTLWDASNATATAWQSKANELGIKIAIDEAAVKSVSGLPFDQCVNQVFGVQAEAIKNLHELLDEAERYEIITYGGSFYEGMQDALQQLQKKYKLFLVSNCQEWYLDAFIKHAKFQSVFEDTLCFGQTNRSKNKNIEEIVKRNKLRKPIYVGDTHWDQEAAFYAKVKFVFARYGFGSVAVSCPAIDSINDLSKLLLTFEKVPSIKCRKLAADDFDEA